MPMNTSYADKHYDRVLTNLSVAHFNESKMVSTSVFPAVTTLKASDKFRTYPKGYFSRSSVDTQIAEESKANRIAYGTKLESYSVDEHALRIFISDKSRANADREQNLDFEATRTLTEHILLGREKDFFDRFMKGGVWTKSVLGRDTALTSAETVNGHEYGVNDDFVAWDAADGGGTPIEDMTKWSREFQERTLGRRPNRLMMSRDVFDTIKHHPDFLSRVEGGATTINPAVVLPRIMAGLFEVEKIQIMEVVHNKAPDGAEDSDGNPAEDIEFMKQNFAFLYYQNPNPSIGLYQATAGVNFVWNAYIQHTDEGGLGAGPYVRRYRETPAVLGEWIESRYASDFRVISPDCGLFIETPLGETTT